MVMLDESVNSFRGKVIFFAPIFDAENFAGAVLQSRFQEWRSLRWRPIENETKRVSGRRKSKNDGGIGSQPIRIVNQNPRYAVSH